MTVYLLHFSPPYKHASHYIGFTKRAVWERIDEHFGYDKSKGSPLVKAVIEAGHVVTIAHIWPEGDRTFERKLKKRKDAPAWCPKCGKLLRPIPKVPA